MKHATAQLWNDERGTAMTEAIILALFFTFICAAIMHMHGMFDAKLKTAAEVRGCTWAYSNNGCRGGLPAHCAGATAENGTNPVGLEQYVAENAEKFEKDSASVLQGGLDFAHDMMDALSIIGKQTTVTRQSQPIPRTPLLGGGSGQVRGKYSVFCNEPTKKRATMVEDAFCRMVGADFEGC